LLSASATKPVDSSRRMRRHLNSEHKAPQMPSNAKVVKAVVLVVADVEANAVVVDQGGAAGKGVGQVVSSSLAVLWGELSRHRVILLPFHFFSSCIGVCIWFC
jgi:hypothetical protein